eukprot:1377359-Prymnesium_polylepis.3
MGNDALPRRRNCTPPRNKGLTPLRLAEAQSKRTKPAALATTRRERIVCPSNGNKAHAAHDVVELSESLLGLVHGHRSSPALQRPALPRKAHSAQNAAQPSPQRCLRTPHVPRGPHAPALPLARRQAKQPQRRCAFACIRRNAVHRAPHRPSPQRLQRPPHECQALVPCGHRLLPRQKSLTPLRMQQRRRKHTQPAVLPPLRRQCVVCSPQANAVHAAQRSLDAPVFCAHHHGRPHPLRKRAALYGRAQLLDDARVFDLWPASLTATG